MGIAYAKYFLNIINNYILETKKFYFNSSVLTINNKHYQINNWDGVSSYPITVDLNNRKNTERYTTSDIDYTIKLLIVGDSSVGKTNFIYRLIEDKFNPNYMTTTGIDLKTINIEIDNKKIRVQLWDTAGQEKYKAITKNLFLKVQGTLVVFDISNEDSFNNSKTWVSSLKEECGRQMQILLIGNKSDLTDKRMVRPEEAAKYAKEENIEYLETSSKTGENIHKSINLLCKQVIENTELERDFSFTLDQSLAKGKKNKCC